jgi:Na+-translocating ferredoxin:NAD+ oxidoreductase RnfD subunit
MQRARRRLGLWALTCLLVAVMQLWFFGAGDRIFLAVAAVLFAVALALMAAAIWMQDEPDQRH